MALGIDLAKNVFALHGVDATGRAMLVYDCRRFPQVKTIGQFLAFERESIYRKGSAFVATRLLTKRHW
jgi:hypothetical protein